MAAKQRTLDVLNADGCAFSSLLLSENVLQGLEKIGFKNPSPVQLKSIPFGKCGLGRPCCFMWSAVCPSDNRLCLKDPS